MSDLATLFFGIAAVIGSAGSAVAGVIVAIRSTRRVAKEAARGVLDRALHIDDDDDDDDEERDEAEDQLIERLLERRNSRRGGDDS